MKSVCPKCKEVILSLGSEETIVCTKCETTFEVKDDLDEDKEN
jgi:uncharacterized protein YbaR (Trm112 family)